jgi:2-amino-4-hydroxy-6-hydroxymethyldihydropteridine diphosphokinase
VRLDVVVGLGSNLGDREATLRSAIEGMRGFPDTEVVAVSSFIETAPVGGPPQGVFMNAAARLSTSFSPRQLLDALLGLELAHGRVRRERWGPRTLDLDVLWIRDVRVHEPGLSVPHPELKNRRFALGPLVEIAPDAVDPESGERYAAVLAALDREG